MRAKNEKNVMTAHESLIQKYPMVDDLIPLAHRRVPRYAIDYLEHGSGRERLVARNRAAFDEVRITPRYLRDDTEVDPSAELFGRGYDLPVGIAPVGMGSLIWPGAELINARAAAKNKVPMTLSTVANASIETVAEIADGYLWYQLYSPKGEAIRLDLMRRARAAGIDVLMVTVDVPVPPRRERTLRSGLSVVPKITVQNVVRAMLHPIWSMEILRKGIPQFRNFAPYLPERASLQEAATFVRSQFGRSISLEELKAIRDGWPGKLIVKGVLHPEDAAAMVDLGVDGLLVSNHGGRGSDAAPASIEALPAIVEAVGERAAVLLDSGVRSGLDVLRARALGADFVLLGRPFFYGIAALGERGADHVVTILKEELVHAMRQHGIMRINGSEPAVQRHP
ncbi:MAG: alpha-hydroxy-acid oxidizing protein [Alphaproteobacteria bacterium]|nr:alpha-hydroxy-acid oxidizing protein [Alphaproteobacteria bacterium]